MTFGISTEVKKKQRKVHSTALELGNYFGTLKHHDSAGVQIGTLKVYKSLYISTLGFSSVFYDSSNSYLNVITGQLPITLQK